MPISPLASWETRLSSLCMRGYFEWNVCKQDLVGRMMDLMRCNAITLKVCMARDAC